MNEIEKQVIKQIKPTQDYRKNLNQIVKELNEKLTNEIKSKNLPVEIKLVGSIAKDTYLEDNMDIDFFLCFPTTFSKEEIANHTSNIGKKLLTDTEESYAEHPYIRGYFKEYYTEIVPCYKIENAKQKLTAVDRTPLHTLYVKENISENLKQDVRLFKQFLKGIGCYGAEAQIEGFSGYLCEILILKYNGFNELINDAAGWKEGVKLSMNSESFLDFDTPLVFIDPVDSNRNVASAISKEKYELFINACKNYIQKPSITFFFPNEIKPWNNDKIKNEINKQDIKYIAISFKKPDIIDENLYPQIRKAIKSIIENLKRADFTIYDGTYYIDENEIIIFIKSKNETLSDTIEHTGPPEKVKENSKDFIAKWKNHPDTVKGPYVKNERYHVEIKRKYQNIYDFLKDNIVDFSMGKHVEKNIKENHKILKQEDIIQEKLRVFWTSYLDGEMSWER